MGALWCVNHTNARWLQRMDALEWEARQRALVGGLLAGNCFDWGAKVWCHPLTRFMS